MGNNVHPDYKWPRNMSQLRKHARLEVEGSVLRKSLNNSEIRRSL